MVSSLNRESLTSSKIKSGEPVFFAALAKTHIDLESVS